MENLSEILNQHKLWLESEGREGKRADLSGANLRHANLSGADLRHADLSCADLDFSVLPLWCGSLSAKFDKTHYIQFLYHILKSLSQNDLVDNDFKSSLLTKENIAIANRFHRVKGCGKIKINDHE